MCLKMCIFGVCAIHQPILPGINLEFCNLNTLQRLVTAISDEGGGRQNKDGQTELPDNSHGNYLYCSHSTLTTHNIGRTFQHSGVF